jgi:hypothetical protein
LVVYDDLLSNSQGVLDDVAEALGLVWPVSFEVAKPALNEFLDRSMCHNSGAAPEVRQEADRRILAFAESVFRQMLFGADESKMNSLRSEFTEMLRYYAGWQFPLRPGAPGSRIPIGGAWRAT